MHAEPIDPARYTLPLLLRLLTEYIQVGTKLNDHCTQTDFLSLKNISA